LVQQKLLLLSDLLSLLIQKNNMKYLLRSVLILASTLILSCGKSKQNTIDDDKQTNKSNLLDRNTYTEEYIKQIIVLGMTSNNVEATIGKPYKTEEFMGTIRSYYLLTPPQSKGLHLIEFIIIYKNNRVKDIDTHWMGM
jgi:outer membrane protein assembly factor BamE (lipoprotein component of BamABCDE complex)